MDEADLERTWIRSLKEFAATRGMNGARLPINYPNRPAIRPSSDVANDPLAHLDASILRPDPFVQGVATGWSVWTRLLQVLVVIKPDVGDIPALDIARDLQLAFPPAMRLVGMSHTYAVTKPLIVATPFSVDGWRIVPTTLTVKTCS